MRWIASVFSALVFALSLPAQAQYAVVRLPSHGASATVIETTVGRSLLLGCGHAFRGADRAKPIVVDAPAGSMAGPPKHVGVKLLAVDYRLDLSLVELADGPLPFVAPVARSGLRNYSGLSVGFDEMRWPATQRSTRILNSDRETTWTAERPWHGRSGGALIDQQSGELIGVVSGYEVTGQQRGIYVSLDAIHAFMQQRGKGVYGPSPPVFAFPQAGPGIGISPGAPNFSSPLSAAPRFYQPCPPSG